MPVVVIDTIKPKNNLTFPIVEDVDVLIKASNKRLSEVVATMATQADIETLQTAINGKASQSDLTALQTAVNGKASQSDLTALSETVSGKASQADLTALSETVSSKASAADLATTNAAVATKAEASDLTSATANLQAQIDNIVSGSTADSEVINARVGVDGTSYGTLKARLDSEGYVQNREITDITGAFINYGTLTDGKFITPTGEESSSSGSKCSDYVEIDAFYSKITLLGITLKGSRSICAYTASKTFISCIATGSELDNEDITFTIPLNTKYIRFTAKDKTPIGFYADTLPSLEAKCNQLNTDINNLYPQNIDYGTLVTGKYIDGNGAEQSDQYSVCSDFVEIEPNSSLILNNISIRGSRCAWGYNALKEPILKLNDEQSSEIFKIETGKLPATVKYIRFSATTAQTPEIKYFQKIATDIDNLSGIVDAISQKTSLIPDIIQNTNYIAIEPYRQDHYSNCTFNANGTVTIAAGGFWFPVFNIDTSIGDAIIIIKGISQTVAISHSATGAPNAEQKQPYLYTESYDGAQVCYIKKADWFEGYPYAHLRIDNRSGESAITVTAVIGGDAHITKSASGENIAYVSTLGSDSNDGTKEYPYLTITKALTSGASKILIAGGVYTETLTIPSRITDLEMRCSELDKRVIIKPTDYIIGTSETKHTEYTKVYYMPYTRSIHEYNNWIYQENVADVTTLITDAERHPLERGYEYRCEDTKIVRCESVTLSDALDEIENADDYRWFLDDDNDTLYYSRPSAVSSSYPITISTGSALFNGFSHQNSVKLVGIETKYLKFNVNRTSTALLDNCKAANVYGAGAFIYDGCQSVKFIRCEALRCQSNTNGDGFNAHSNKTGDTFSKQTTALFIDCYAHDNLDDGYSDHERSETTIIGGLYEYNGKGGVTPSYGSHCTCYDVYSRNNYAGFYYTGDNTVEEGGKYGQLICYNCIAENNQRGGSRTGYRVDGVGNTGVLVNCKSISNNIGYYADSQSGLTLIDCGSSGDAQIKNSVVTTKNTTLVV